MGATTSTSSASTTSRQPSTSAQKRPSAPGSTASNTTFSSRIAMSACLPRLRTICPMDAGAAPDPAAAVVPLGERIPASGDADSVVEAFLGWVADRGLTLYDAQEEALFEIAPGAH